MKETEKYKPPVIKQISYWDQKYSIGNVVNNIIITSYGDRCYYLLLMVNTKYVIVKSFCCTPESNIVCQLYFD